MSIQWRNYLVGYSADELLRLLLFWSMFLPLGACWSVDRLRGAVPDPPSTRVLSVATAGLFLQIAFVYWFTALLKTGPEWRVDGTALYYALSAKQLVTPIGAYLLQFPDLLKVLTFGTLAVEIVAPLLLFSPFFTVPARIAGIIGIVGLHVGISMTLAVGYFPWIGAACMVCFLPSWFWDTLVPQIRLDPRQLFSRVRPAWQAVAGIGHPSWAIPWMRLLSPAGVGRLSIAELPLATSGHAAPARAGRPVTGEAVPASQHVGLRYITTSLACCQSVRVRMLDLCPGMEPLHDFRLSSTGCGSSDRLLPRSPTVLGDVCPISRQEHDVVHRPGDVARRAAG